MSEQEYVENRGLRFPAHLDVPDQAWYQIDFGGTSEWDLTGDGYQHLAHQAGIDGIETTIVDSGHDDDGIRYAAARAVVIIEPEADDSPGEDSPQRFTAVAGADEASNQVREPDYVWSVAETRALKRAVKRALNIHDAEPPDPSVGDGSPPAADPDELPANGPDGSVEVSSHGSDESTDLDW